MLGDDGDGAISAAHDGAFVIEGIGAAKVDDEAGVFGTAHEGDGGSDFNAEGFVLLGVGDAGFCGGESALAAPDVDGTGRRCGATSVSGGTNAGRIGGGADVALNFLFGVFADHEAGEEKWKNEQTTENCKVAVHLHFEHLEKRYQRSEISYQETGRYKSDRAVGEFTRNARLPGKEPESGRYRTT